VTEPLTLSLLNDHLYCPRRAALKVVEGWREANVHTERGDIVHEHADLPGYEVAKGVLLWRALPVFSERLGLNGKCDIVEVEPAPGAISDGGSQIPGWKSEIGNLKTLSPVEFKLGKRRPWANDDVQLCAQALCLEEMFGMPVARGAIFHADSKRRRDVEFTPELRTLTEDSVAALRRLLGQCEMSDSKSEIPRLPPAVLKPACQECSLYHVCLPALTGDPGAVVRATRALFEI
jgi:CRISPR-associated exonuclease Cas4